MMGPKSNKRTALAGTAREAKEACARLWVAGGRTAIECRLEEMQLSMGAGLMVPAEEWCALKALRGDFDDIGALAPDEDRNAPIAVELEGRCATEADEETECDGPDRAVVSDALAASSLRR